MVLERNFPTLFYFGHSEYEHRTQTTHIDNGMVNMRCTTIASKVLYMTGSRRTWLTEHKQRILTMPLYSNFN